MTKHHKKVRKTSNVLANRYVSLTLSLGAVLGIGAAGAAPALAESQPRAASGASHPDESEFEGVLGGPSRNMQSYAPWLCRHGHGGAGLDLTEESGDIKALVKDLATLTKSSRTIDQNFKQYVEAAARDSSRSAAGKDFQDFLRGLQGGTGHGLDFGTLYSTARDLLNSPGTELPIGVGRVLKQGDFDLSKALGQITAVAHQAADHQQGRVHLPSHQHALPSWADPATPKPGNTGLVGGWQPAKDLTDPHIQEIAQWAVAEANRKQNLTGDAAYGAVSVLSAQTQVVSGANYRLQIRLDRPSPMSMEAVVWEKPWENFRSLTSFHPPTDPVAPNHPLIDPVAPNPRFKTYVCADH